MFVFIVGSMFWSSLWPNVSRATGSAPAIIVFSLALHPPCLHSWALVSVSIASTMNRSVLLARFISAIPLWMSLILECIKILSSLLR